MKMKLTGKSKHIFTDIATYKHKNRSLVVDIKVLYTRRDLGGSPGVLCYYSVSVYKLLALLEKQPFMTRNACRKMLKQRANACQYRPWHSERRQAFVRRLFTTCIYDMHL